jgi:hypothetical protein
VGVYIDHDLIHSQTMANQERVDQLSKHFEHVYVELNPGEWNTFFFKLEN